MTIPVSDSDALAYPRQPELVLGLVAPIGTPLNYFKKHLSKMLKARQFQSVELKLSAIAASALAPNEKISELKPYERYIRLMKLGNELRERTGRDDALAVFAAAELNTERPQEDPKHFAATAWIIDQLKRPEEVFRLRRIYGDHFLLLGVYCPKDIRRQHLEHMGMDMDAEAAADLIAKDADDAVAHGQRLVDTFHLSDVFFDVSGNVGDLNEGEMIDAELDRFWNLLFGLKIVTPTRNEYGMYLAHAASLRSSALARQVGAAIMSASSEVISLGANDIPCYPGGLYWGDEVDKDGESRDARDHLLGYDESDRMKQRIVNEIVPLLSDDWNSLHNEVKQARLQEALGKLRGTRITSLTEFARAVHAEMEAISAAARQGASIRGATLFTTTFPCHNCAKHIVATGIKSVVYIEPYPKSRALEMYGDSIHAKGESAPGDRAHKVEFSPFVGVAPRRFADLFSRYSHEGKQMEYKDKGTGDLIPEEVRLRIAFSPFSYVIREGMAASDFKGLKERIDAPKQDGAPTTATQS